VIQRMLRHSSPNMRMHYTHSDARKAQEEFVDELVPSVKSFIVNDVKGKRGIAGAQFVRQWVNSRIIKRMGA
jgi:hypothetical protein